MKNCKFILISLFVLYCLGIFGCLTTTETNDVKKYPIGEPIQYVMLNQFDCGPCCVSSVTGIPIGEIKHVWGWKDFNSELDDVLDTPLSHYAILNELGIKYKIVNCGEILSGNAIPRRTVILIHGLIKPFLNQHWVVLYDYPASNTVKLLMGDSELPKSFTFDNFQKLYSGGTPACAYQIMIE